MWVTLALGPGRPSWARPSCDGLGWRTQGPVHSSTSCYRAVSNADTVMRCSLGAVTRG